MKTKDPLGAYRPALTRWLPGSVAVPAEATGADALVEWAKDKRRVRWVAEIKFHFATQDAGMLAAKLAATAAGRPGVRPLLLAPYVRREQAVVLLRNGVDYADLAGNAHLEAPGRYVHVEGKRPEVAPRAVTHPGRGWVRIVLAILVRPQFLKEPYRPLANAAGVALGTVVTCMNDLKARRLLTGDGDDRHLVNVPELLALWAAAYVDVLRPRLAERRYQVKAAGKPEIWRTLERVLPTRDVAWTLTGADAAEIAVGHFHAEDTEIYADTNVFDERALLVALHAQPAKVGNLRVIEPPAPIALQVVRDETVRTAPTLLQYAELRYRGTEQAQEAADMLLPKLLNYAQH